MTQQISTPKTYLDYSATTPVDPRVLEAMLPYFSEIFGNASSVHTYGQQAEAAIERARETMAGILNCRPGEIVFTSCGTESDNLALRGTAMARREEFGANHILISPVEHHAVGNTARQLADRYGFELEFLPVDEFGRVAPEAVEKRLREDTACVSIIYANNEIGTINPLSEIGAVCRGRGVPFHTDAVQAGSLLSLDVEALQVDLLSLGAHKFYGPKGVGALYVRRGTSLLPAQTGGAHERGLRAGTPNTPYLVGMAEALQISQSEKEASARFLQDLREELIDRVLATIPEVRLTGHSTQRLPNHTSFVFRGVDGNLLLMMLDVEGFACSSGSACKTGLPEPSEVLTAIGLEPEWALGSLRVTLGRHTTRAEMEAFLSVLPEVIARNREIQTRPVS